MGICARCALARWVSWVYADRVIKQPSAKPTRFHVMLPPDMRKRLEDEAKLQYRSVGNLIVFMLEEAFREKDAT